MNIWYDVSGLVSWSRPHLGGIERVTTGILAGLLDHGATVGLVHVPPQSTTYAPLALAALPETVRRHVAIRTPCPREHGGRLAFAPGEVLLSLGGTWTTSVRGACGSCGCSTT
jgi:hypothetical protein